MQNNNIHKMLVRCIKCVLWPLGALFFLVWIYLNWAEPSMIGFDRKAYVAQGAVQVWVVRLLYIYVILFAIYRSYAELGERFDLPYELWATTLAFIAPVLLVMAMMEFQWFI